MDPEDVVKGKEQQKQFQQILVKQQLQPLITNPVNNYLNPLITNSKSNRNYRKTSPVSNYSNALQNIAVPERELTGISALPVNP